MPVPVDFNDLRFAAFRRAVYEGARDKRVQALALALAGVACDPQAMPRELADAVRDGNDSAIRIAQARALLRAVQNRVRYVDDYPLQKPFETWASGVGDCKSSASLLAALALSIGCPANLVAMGWDGAAQHNACILAPVPGRGWLWAETTIPGAELGEHPSIALARLGDVAPARVRRDLHATQLHRRRGARRARARRREDGASRFAPRIGVVRARASKAEHAYAGHVMALAFEQVNHRAASLFERQLLQAVALEETHYGRGWQAPCQNSHNWGSVHATGNAPSCAYTDSYPDGTRYDQAIRVYPSDVDGAAAIIELIYKHMPGVRRALEKEQGIKAFSTAMVYSHYAGSVCPNAVAKFGAAAVHDATQFWPVIPGHRATTEAGKACEQEAIALHAKVIRDAAFEIADALGEPRPSFGPSGPSTKKIIAGVSLAALVGGGGYALWRHAT